MPRLEADRSLAARVARQADLQDIRLFGSASTLLKPAVEGTLSYTLSSNMTFQTLGDPIGTLVVSGEYEIVVLESSAEGGGPEDGDEDVKVAQVEFTLAALFRVDPLEEGKKALEDKEYEAFAATTGQFALYPYAREFVSDVTSRMGLPALHIGALRFQLDSRTGD